MGRIIGLNGSIITGAEPMKQMAASVGISGPGADFHVEKYRKKIAKCPLDCGVDLFPREIASTAKVGNLMVYLVSTGVHILLPPGSYGRIVSRSSSIEKLAGGWVIDGTIDAGYTGEYYIRIAAQEEQKLSVVLAISIAVETQVALAQVVIAPFMVPIFVAVNLDQVSSDRGTSGFGSTDEPKKGAS